MANTLYGGIVEQLRRQIESGDLAEGDQVPTEQELSAHFGVSRITSARAVKELEQAGMVVRVRGKGTFVTERTTWTASTSRKASIISIVLPFGRTGDGYPLLEGLETAARAEKQMIALHNSAGSGEQEREIITEAIDHDTSGLIIYPFHCLRNMDVFSRLLANDVPFVLLDRPVLGIDASFVGPDNVAGVEALTRHLIELGHERVAYVGHTRTGQLSEQARFVGYCRAMVSAHLPIHEEYLHIVDEQMENDPDFSPQVAGDDHDIGEFGFPRLIRATPPPTAIVAVNDLAAVVVLRAALEWGLRVPEDLAITGFDDLPVASHLNVPLTTIAQPFYEIGHTAVELLRERVSDPGAPHRKVLLPGALRVRASTAGSAAISANRTASGSTETRT